MTSNRRNQDRSRTEASARVGSLLFKQLHYSLLPKKGRPQPYSQIVTASTPHKDVHSAMVPSCEAAGDVGRGLGMGSNMREQPDAGSSSTLWSQHSSAVKPSFHVRKMERTTLCVNPRLSHADTLIHCNTLQMHLTRLSFTPQMRLSPRGWMSGSSLGLCECL